MYNGDNTFLVLKNRIGEANLNIVSRVEHVGRMEKTTKERTKAYAMDYHI